MFNVIKNILGGLLYVILFLFTGVQACVAGVNANSKAYTQEERIAFFNENRACFEELASSGFTETKNVTSGMGKTNVQDWQTISLLVFDTNLFCNNESPQVDF